MSKIKQMKILVVSQQYWPEYWRITDICEELVKRGNDVTVLCGLPNYETGRIRPEYLHKKNRNEIHNGVKIIRCHEHPRKRNPIDLFLNYLSFPRSGKRIIRTLDDDFDVVLLNGLSPILQSKPGLLYAKKHHKKCLMYCLDLWPASLAAGGIRNKGLFKPVYSLFTSISSKIYQKCDEIYVTSIGFKDYLSDICGVNPNNIEYLPQYSENVFLKPAEPLFLNEGKKNFVFAGNVGKAQDVLTIIKAALLIKGSSVAIDIVGDGSALQKAKEYAKSVSCKNVYFFGRMPFEKMPAIYAGADAMLVTLSSDEFANLVVPGKMQTYMAAAKPIIGACGQSVKQIIDDAECGFCVASGDYQALAEAIMKFCALPKSVADKMGISGQKFSELNFSKETFFKKLDDAISVAKQ
jgi:glycosyltransferase involved in cell wall biosynthesis